MAASRPATSISSSRHNRISHSAAGLASASSVNVIAGNTTSSTAAHHHQYHALPLGAITSALSAPELEDRLLRMADDREALQRRNNDLEDKLKKVGTRYLRLLKGESSKQLMLLGNSGHSLTAASIAALSESGGHLATHERDALAMHINKVEKENIDLRRLVQILRVENQRFNSSLTNFSRRNQHYIHVAPRIDTGLASAALSRMSHTSSRRSYPAIQSTTHPYISQLLRNHDESNNFVAAAPSSHDNNNNTNRSTSPHTTTQQPVTTSTKERLVQTDNMPQQQQQDQQATNQLLSNYTQLMQRLDEKCSALQNALTERFTLMEQLTARMRTQHDRYVSDVDKAFENNVKLIRAKRELEQAASELRALKLASRDESTSSTSLKSLLSTFEHDNEHLKAQLESERERTKQLRLQANDDAFQRVETLQHEKRNIFLEKECALLREQNESLLKKTLLDAQQPNRSQISTPNGDLWRSQIEAEKYAAHRRELDEKQAELEQLKHERSTLIERLRVAESTLTQIKVEITQTTQELLVARENYNSIQTQLDAERLAHRSEIAKLKPQTDTKSIETLKPEVDSKRINTSPEARRQERGTQQTPSLLSMQPPHNDDVEQLRQHKQLLDEIEKLRNVVIAQAQVKNDLEKEARLKNQNLRKMRTTVRHLKQRLSGENISRKNHQPVFTSDENNNKNSKSPLSDDLSVSSTKTRSSSSTEATPSTQRSHWNLHKKARSKSAVTTGPTTSSPQSRLPTARSRIVELFIRSFEITVDDYFFVDRAYFLSIRFLSNSLEDSPLVRVNELDATIMFSYRAKYIMPMYEANGIDLLSLLNAKRIEFYLFEVFKAEKSLVAQTVVGVDQLTFERSSASNSETGIVGGTLVARATVGLYSDFKVPVGLLVFKLSYKPFEPDAGLAETPTSLGTNLVLRPELTKLAPTARVSSSIKVGVTEQKRSKSQVEFSRNPSAEKSNKSINFDGEQSRRPQSASGDRPLLERRHSSGLPQKQANKKSTNNNLTNYPVDDDESAIDDFVIDDFELDDDDDDLAIAPPLPAPRHRSRHRSRITVAQ